MAINGKTGCGLCCCSESPGGSSQQRLVRAACQGYISRNHAAKEPAAG